MASTPVVKGTSIADLQRLRITIRGAVQGVGFRPFIYRLAVELGLQGWVNNSSLGVFIEVEGRPAALEEFLARIGREKPTRSFIQSLEASWLDPVGFTAFEIRPSEGGGRKSALVLPDIATCPDCRREIFDPADRRYRYPFTNCTNCGPRFSIITALPYDRPSTTMRGFTMCAQCRVEYENPHDRRFHAQPNACPQCGPYLELWDRTGAVLAERDDALREAAAALRQGKIVAVKGLGGFHLMADARSAEAVALLRQRKCREEKPFALMYPALDAVRAHCQVSPAEERLLLSPEAPIVLLQRHGTGDANVPADGVAPGNPTLGAMLPYTPLHHLLLADLGFPVVATSGNLSDEPICIDEREAPARLAGLADLFLVHNRPILRHVDDSIVRVVLGRELVLRRARGYAPLPVHLPDPLPTVLAAGAHLKNTVAAATGNDIFVSQHIGDLETVQAYKAFHRVLADLTALYELQPAGIACDLHPDYLSSKYARESGLPVTRVQHHYAHVLACMAENALRAPVLGVSWDGTGYGPDGSVWGGEFLRIGEEGFTRAGHLRCFRLPGGDTAVKEPRRAALGLLYELYGGELPAEPELAPVQAFSPAELKILLALLRDGINAPWTSSAGRLFDAVAALVNGRGRVRYEGQAAMEVEFLAGGDADAKPYPFSLITDDAGPVQVDWAPMIAGIIDDLAAGAAPVRIAAGFHCTLAEMIVAMARRVGEERVVLTGGCFQNRLLTELAVQRLREEGFRPYWHQRIPPNDGGIALGQVVAVARAKRK